MNPIKQATIVVISFFTRSCIVNLFGSTYVVSHQLIRRIR